MTKILGACAIAGLVCLQTARAELNWTTDVPKAVAKAKAEKKLVMLDFTGSDWCIWCKRLHGEIFSKPEFEAYAQKNLVLVEVDFPRKKEQSAELKKANKALQEKYSIEGYPTLIILNGDGKQVGKLGYMRGGPNPFIGELEKIQGKKN